jgi:hypothetical protein
MNKNKMLVYLVVGGLFWYMIRKGMNPIEPEQLYAKQAPSSDMFPTDTMLPGALIPATQGIVKTPSGLSYMGCGCLGCGC